MRNQRGFTLIETLAVAALVAAATVWILALRLQPPNTRAAALGLQAALAETRSLAMSTAGAGDSGAMLSIEPSGNGTVVSVYVHRPIPGSRIPVRDDGFVPLRFANVAITVPGRTTAAEPFSILVSSSGYASVAPNYAFDPKAPKPLASDPGCDEATGETIAVSAGGAVETHALDCRETQYDVSH